MKRSGQSKGSGFSLIEMMVVIAIIGLLAALALPSLRGYKETNAMEAANRQLLDDLALARLRAINEHTTVYVVFIPPGIERLNAAGFTPRERQVFSNLVERQLTSYALFTRRAVGEQPGRENPRYLTEWRSLPEGIFIAPPKFNYGSLSVIGQPLENNPMMPAPIAFTGFETNAIPFPTASSMRVPLPTIAFNYLGQVTRSPATPSGPQAGDEVIPLSRGSIFYQGGVADVVETPPGNWADNYNIIRINWLTGRARVERVQLP